MRQILSEVEALADLSHSLEEGLSGTLRLGTTPTIGPYFLPSLVQHLHANFPELKLVIRDGAPRDLLDDLLTGRHDLVLTQLPVTSDELVARRLYREPLFLAVARDHPLAMRDRVAPEDLAGHDMLSLSPAYALHGQIAALCRDVGAHLRSDYEGTSLDALRQMVAMNMGTTLLPALYLRSEVPQADPDVIAVGFRGGLYRGVGLVWRRATGKPKLLDRFAAAAEEVVTRSFADRVRPETAG